MIYTVSDVKNKAKDLGWDYNTAFSDADRRLIEQNPDAGMSILNFKMDWQNAETDEQRLRANEGANRIREQYGSYTANDSGEGFYSVPSAPTYKGTYDDQYDALLQQYVNAPSFSYDAEKDPLYSSYKKTYAREGQRATQDTMASAAAMTGGLPSSYAVGAAQQAGNVYSAAMADKVPELYQIAYNKYLNELDIAASKANAVGNAMNTEYNRYMDSWNQYNTDRNYYATQAQQAIDNAYRNQQYADARKDIEDQKNSQPTTGQTMLYNDVMFGSGISGNGGVTNLTGFDTYQDAWNYIKNHSDELQTMLGDTLYKKMLDDVRSYYDQISAYTDESQIETEQPDIYVLAENAFRNSGKDFKTWALENMFNVDRDVMNQLASVYLPEYSEYWYANAYNEANENRNKSKEVADFANDQLLFTPLPVPSDIPSEFVDIYTGQNKNDGKVAGILGYDSKSEKGTEGTTVQYWKDMADKYAKEAGEAFQKGDTAAYQEAVRKMNEAKAKYESLKEQEEYNQYMKETPKLFGSYAGPTLK